LDSLKNFTLVVFLGTMIIGPTLLAETATGKVSTLGCHAVDDTCYLSIAGFNQSEFCNKSSSIRWDASTSYGNRFFAALLLAKALETEVSLAIHPAKCSAQGFPTLYYGTF
jgi:hypothetical protein